MNADDYVKGLKTALSDPSVVDILKELICLPMVKEIEELRADLAKKDETILHLQRNVSELELKCDDLEQYSRRNNLRICGLPENPEEKLLVDLPEFLNKELKISPPVTTNDICRTHRIGPPGQQKPRAVILKLATYQVRERIYGSRAKLKNYSRQVFVNEDLTKLRSRLLWKGRQMKKAKVIADTWTHDGRVLIKTLKGKTQAVSSMPYLETFVE